MAGPQEVVQNLKLMTERLYESSLSRIFSGTLELIVLKTTPIKFISKSQIQEQYLSSIARHSQPGYCSGATLFFLSKVLRALNLQAMFEGLAETMFFKPKNDGQEQWLQNEVWQAFMLDKIPQIKDRYDLYSIQLRKMFIDHYHDKFNRSLTQYFWDLKQKSRNLQNLGSSDEPANISS